MAIKPIGPSRGLKRIEHAHPTASEATGVARHHGEIVQQGDGGDLLVDGVVGSGHPQSPPDLGCIALEVEHPVAVGLQPISEPLLQQLGLRMAAPVADQLHAAAQRTDADRSQKEAVSSRAVAAQEACTPTSARWPLRASLITLVSLNTISGRRWLLLALGISVHAHIRHGRQQVHQLAPRWAQQHSGKNGPQLGFLAAAMGPGPLLACLHEGVIDTADQKVSHGAPSPLIARL